MELLSGAEIIPLINDLFLLGPPCCCETLRKADFGFLNPSLHLLILATVWKRPQHVHVRNGRNIGKHLKKDEG